MLIYKKLRCVQTNCQSSHQLPGLREKLLCQFHNHILMLSFQRGAYMQEIPSRHEPWIGPSVNHVVTCRNPVTNNDTCCGPFTSYNSVPFTSATNALGFSGQNMDRKSIFANAAYPRWKLQDSGTVFRLTSKNQLNFSHFVPSHEAEVENQFNRHSMTGYHNLSANGTPSQWWLG